MSAIARIGIWLFVLSSAVVASASDDVLPVSGDSRISARFGESEIVITTTSRLAGAIHSLRWNGMEFIDSTDHGRQLQSASAFDPGFPAETFNPTEAGSRDDGAGRTSTSQLLFLRARSNQLQTTTRMAFWLRPGQLTEGHPSRNKTDVSDHLLTKRVIIGDDRFPNVIHYDVTFSLPVAEPHTTAQFEALTGYMPPTFRRFLQLDPTAREVTSLSDGPGEQPHPIIFSTESGSHAMGIYSPDQPSPGFERAGYGRWRFAAQRVVKWNCVFRLKREPAIPAGDYSYHCKVVVGSLDDVTRTMLALMEIQKP